MGTCPLMMATQRKEFLTMAKKLYEVEIQRSGITPKAFYNICKREVERRTEYRATLTEWIDDFRTWEEPIYPTKTTSRNEICTVEPLRVQYFLRDGYNFIMEFDFWDEKKGVGYLYIVEYER